MQKATTDQKSDSMEVARTLRIACRSGNAITGVGQYRPSSFQSRRHQKGQIVFEYVLLLVIAVGAATALSKLLVSRNAESGGVLTSAWSRTINTIGSDKID